MLEACTLIPAQFPLCKQRSNHCSARSLCAPAGQMHGLCPGHVQTACLRATAATATGRRLWRAPHTPWPAVPHTQVDMPTLFQELGHNIGMLHSNRFINWVNMEYEDFTDPMGSGGPNPMIWPPNTTMACLNAPAVSSCVHSGPKGGRRPEAGALSGTHSRSLGQGQPISTNADSANADWAAAG